MKKSLKKFLLYDTKEKEIFEKGMYAFWHMGKKMGNSNEINEDEVFEKKESKIKPKLQKIFKNKIVIFVLVIILIIAILAGVELGTGAISGLFTMGENGNSAGNIINCGYSVGKDGYIYYVSPSEDMYTTQISRVKSGTKDPDVIYTGSYDIRGLNIIGNQIYFINISIENTTDEDGVDNKICKMNLDGSNLEVINDNDFSYDYYDLHIVKNHIYYVGEDQNVYQMDLNGGNRKLVAETGTGYLAINDKYIIYNRSNEESSDYITYIRPLKGGEERAITSSRIVSPIIEQDFIYYLDGEGHLAKTPIAGGNEEKITDYAIYNINISNGFIYYLSYKDEASEDYTVAVYKLSLNGGEPEMIKELSNYSSFLNVTDGYVYYMDMDDEKAFINLVNVNDSNEIRLYEWEYQNY